MARRTVAYMVLASLVAGCGGHARSVVGHEPRSTPPPRRRARSRAASPLGPNPLRGAAARHAAVPILMYHVIAPAPAGTAYPELWVAPRRFGDAMRALQRAGYRGVTIEQVLAAWRTGAPLPRRPLVISFDDGYPSQYKRAFPVLRRLGWPGVLNLEVNDLGAAGIRVREVRALVSAGWEIDSHTITHPDLTTVGPARLRRELVDSKAVLRRRFGSEVAKLFCYPAGRYNATVEQAVRAAGYAAATTADPGWATARADRFALPRIRVDGSASPQAVLAGVRSGTAV